MEHAVEEIDRLLNSLAFGKVLTHENKQAIREYLIIWADQFQ